MTASIQGNPELVPSQVGSPPLLTGVTKAWRLLVANPPMSNVYAIARISDLGPTTPIVVMFAGGRANEPVSFTPEGRLLCEAYRDAGFTVVEVWYGIPGGNGWWPPSGGSLRFAGGRGAAVVEWVMRQMPGRPLTIYGQSGGAMLGALIVGTYGGHAYASRLVLSGGPPTTLMQHLCPTPPAQAWVDEATAAMTACGFTPANYPLTAPSGSLGWQAVAGRVMPGIAEDGVIWAIGTAGPVLDYPNMGVHVVLGLLDGYQQPGVGSAIPQACVYYQRVTAGVKNVRQVATAGHVVYEVPEGITAILEESLP